MSFRYAIRSLRARPAFAAAVIATIALVVAPSASVLAVIDATLVRPLPFAEGDRVVQLFTMPPGVQGDANRNPLGSIDFVRFRQHARELESIAGIWAREAALGGDAEPESVSMAQVSPNLFQMLGAAPITGRTFTEAEDRANAKVVVLGYGLWERRFGRDPGIVGRRISIDREDYDVVGVMGPSFTPAFVASELWTPLAIYEGNLILPNATFIQSFARLAPKATPASARDEVAAVMRQVAAERPDLRRGWTTKTVTLREARYGASQAPLMMLLAAIIAIGLLACANLTNLTLAEAAGRRGEWTLRAALGAGRLEVIGVQVLESVLLAAGGAAAGLVLAAWMLPATLALNRATTTPLGTPAIDLRVGAAAAALALAVSLAAGMAAALGAVRGELATALTSISRRSGGSAGRRKIRSALVGAQTMIAVVLLVAGAMLIHSLDRLSRSDPGFEPRQVLGAQLRLPAVVYGAADKRVQFVHDVLERVRAVPGVVAASTTHNLFVPGFAFVSLIAIDGRPSPDGQPYTVQFRRVSPGYFAAMRIPERRGRTFDDRDGPSAQQAAVVSQSLADRFWPGEDALGQRVLRGGKPLTVIGIVGDVHDVSLTQPVAPTVYVAYAQQNVVTASIGLVVRTAGDPMDFVRPVAAAVHAVDPAEPLSNVTTLDRFLADSVGPERFRSVVLLTFAGLGLVLAAVGIYGVTSRGVAERWHEMGLRMALGSEPRQIRRLILRQSLAAVGAGFVAGAIAAAATSVALRHLLTDLDPAIPLLTIPALLTLAAAAVAAAAIPAIRAGRVDPLIALRAE